MDEILLEQLPPGTVITRHNYTHYSHMDFVWGMDAHTIVYPRVLELLAAAKPQPATCMGACNVDADCPSPCGSCWNYICDPCNTKRCNATSPCPSQCAKCSYSFCLLA